DEQLQWPRPPPAEAAGYDRASRRPRQRGNVMGNQATTELTRAEHAVAMADYLAEGERRAEAIGNRGPARFDAAGRLHPDILDAYREHGFYVFEGVVGPHEVAELRAGAAEMLERAPARKGAALDAQGRPPLGVDYAV